MSESREETRQRLTEGIEYDHMECIKGAVLRGVLDAPFETTGKVVGMPAEETDKILSEVAEIKLLLFCRLLLSQAAVLPNALKAQSIEEFLKDSEVATADLRNLCLRLEQPSLQEFRDACANFFRGDAADEDISDDHVDIEDASEAREVKNLQKFKHKHVPDRWQSKHELAVQQRKEARKMVEAGDSSTAVDFGVIEEGTFKNKNIRIKVCGKTIWSYASDNAMKRSGWLHYSIIAKGSLLFDAIELCRNWAEFWELSTAAIFQYFPAPYWGQWAGDRARQQFLQLGFIPYLQFHRARQMTFEHQIRDPKRRTGPSKPLVCQTRNVIAAHIKRNDPVSRRFVQYLAMSTHRVVLMVRDAKTGRMLVTPPAEECWLARDRVQTRGLEEGDDEDDWRVTKTVDETLFEQMSGKKHREWQFGFTDYYDVVIFDLDPGEPIAVMCNLIQEKLFKAHRCVEGHDFYAPMAPVLQTLWRDPKTLRVRDARPGEFTIYDELLRSRFVFGPLGSNVDDMTKHGVPPNLLYNGIDAEEDDILFPEEITGRVAAVTDRTDAITMQLERHGPNWKRFINDLDSDQESDDFPGLGVEEVERESAASSTAASETNRGAESGFDDDQVLSRVGSADGSDWLTESEPDGDSDEICDCRFCKRGQFERCNNPATRKVIFDTSDNDPETLLLALAFEEIKPSPQRDVSTDFRFFAERENAKVFKKQ